MEFPTCTDHYNVYGGRETLEGMLPIRSDSFTTTRLGTAKACLSLQSLAPGFRSNEVMLWQNLFLSIFLTPVLGAPALESRQGAAVDCSPSSKTGLKPECWKQLNVETFINDWIKANGTDANCGQLGFAQCFLQFNGFTGLTCDLITSNTCPPFPTTDNSKYYSEQQFYALWNIYTIYQFFNQYSQALSNGASLAGQTIDDIVATVGPPVEAQAGKDSLMTVLGATLGIVTTLAGVVPGGAATTGASFILSGIGNALGIAPELGTTLLVTQTANDRFLQLGKIGSGLASLVEDYQANLLKMVQTIQGDAALFNAAASTGGFSQRVTTSLTVQSSDLFHQLQLFVLSQALQANGIVSSRSTGVDVLEFAKETDQISCDAFGPGGNCNQWWFDPANKNTYALHNGNDRGNTQIALTQAIVDKGWATLDEVFKVEDCAGKGVTFDATKLGATCLATHGFCEWNYVETAARTQPQFKNCGNDKDWGTLCGSFQSGILVPESYLGPLFKFSAGTCKKL
ncbi:hypothetical protein VTL71DRAFT_13383 [Oculimacula yallundae]|uniref:Uncharacterized protein n=1 Tax=Oculimacula yallundae TaxID=86028 RepID=A0ABR4CK69_9HELO